MPQVEEFKYLGILLTCDGRLEFEMDRWIGASSAVIRGAALVRYGEGAELE